MRKKPTYDWEWFESHAPFKSTLEKMCDLQINHEVQRIPTIAGCWATNHHFKIKYNRQLFERDFELIKSKLLKTNICKNNKDVYEFVEEQTCRTRSFCDLIVQGCGCYKYGGGSFEWDDMSGGTMRR
jgi:hypothetical protein